MTDCGRRGRLAPLLVAVMLCGGWLLALSTAGCEAVLGTGELRESAGTSDAGDASDADPFGDDDDADVDDAFGDDGDAGDASVLRDGSLLDAGDAANADAGDGASLEGGPSSTSPSCVPSANASAHDCGPAGTDDCCATAKVTGGIYYRIDQAGTRSAQVSVSAYDLDVYEVTVGRMRAYAAWLATASGKAPVDGAGVHTYLNQGLGIETIDELGPSFASYETGWSSSNDTYLTLGASASNTFADVACTTTYTGAAASTDNRPMNCVGWYDAYAFCIWDGGFLPSEAEWELAAVAGPQQLAYPWGTAPIDHSHAVYGCSSESLSCPGPVGTDAAGIGSYQQYDLLGNVSEWTLDDYASSYSATDGCVDCAYVSDTATAKVDRGGAWLDSASSEYLGSQDRGSVTGGAVTDIVGFRCARAPK